MWRRISLRAVRGRIKRLGRAKPELLMGTYQKFVAASVGEKQKEKKKKGVKLKRILMIFMSPVVQSSSPVQ